MKVFLAHLVAVGLTLSPCYSSEVNWQNLSIPESLGVSVHFRAPLEDGGWSVNDAQLAKYEAQMDQIVDLGLKVVRIDNAWQWTNKEKGMYDFAPHQRLVDALEKRGLRPLTILCFADPRLEKHWSIRTKEGGARYAEFCARMVKEFKGRGVIWEMWNEPNLQSFWQPKADSKEYMQAIKEAMIAMRKADPDCTIVASSPCTVDIPFLKLCFQEGLLDTVSAVSVHSYCDAPESMFPRYLQLKNLIGGRDIPIVCTEWGFSRVFVGTGNRIRSQDEQASLVARSILVDLMSGVPLHVIYTNLDYSDKLEWNEASFGLSTFEGKPKKAFLAVKNLIEQLKGKKFVRQLTSGSADLFECSPSDFVSEFGDQKETMVVAWTTGPEHAIKFGIPGEPGKLVNLYGEKLPEPHVKEKFVHIPVSSDPVFLAIKRP